MWARRTVQPWSFVFSFIEGASQIQPTTLPRPKSINFYPIPLWNVATTNPPKSTYDWGGWLCVLVRVNDRTGKLCTQNKISDQKKIFGKITWAKFDPKLFDYESTPLPLRHARFESTKRQNATPPRLGAPKANGRKGVSRSPRGRVGGISSDNPVPYRFPDRRSAWNWNVQIITTRRKKPASRTIFGSQHSSTETSLLGEDANFFLGALLKEEGNECGFYTTPPNCGTGENRTPFFEKLPN